MVTLTVFKIFNSKMKKKIPKYFSNNPNQDSKTELIKQITATIVQTIQK
jgi:hypothetical protein